jgi:hypothetical protein
LKWTRVKFSIRRFMPYTYVYWRNSGFLFISNHEFYYILYYPPRTLLNFFPNHILSVPFSNAGIVTDFATCFRKCYVESKDVSCWLFQSFTDVRLVARSTGTVIQVISATCFTYGEKPYGKRHEEKPAKLSSQNRTIRMFLLT